MRETFLTALIVLLAFPAMAFVQPGESLPDPALEARAQTLYNIVRCPQCEGQTIGESNAGLAADLRHVIRVQLVRGKTDAEIIEFLQERYGDDIVTNPPLKTSTALLWAGPFLILLLGGLMAFSFIRKAEKP